jgi:DNA helicase-2/ATP-dependent DNA helicase PcrA
MKLFLGPPGTGKTTRLIRGLEGELEHCEPDEVGYFAFTRKAAEEARSRVKKRFGFNDDDLPFFRTLHSFAFRALGLSRDQVMGAKDYAELGDAIGIKIGAPDPEFGIPLGNSLGDRLVLIEQLARVKGSTLERELQHTNPWQARLYADALAAFKQSRSVIDFTDMITEFLRAGAVPRFRAVFIDEAQDLSPIHWQVVDALRANADSVYIAGDDDQAIYVWAGADIGRFRSLPATHREVLPRSHRLTRQTWDLSNRIAQRIGDRYPKEWQPRDEDGKIVTFDRLDDIHMDDGDWLVLARHNYLLSDSVEAVRRQGLPYTLKGASSVDNATVRAILSWERLRKGEAVGTRAVREMQAILRPEFVRVRLPRDTPADAMFTLGTLGYDAVPPDWMIALRMGDREREYYRAVLRRGESLSQPPRVRIGTIHGSKGGEADNVVLMSDMSSTCHEGYTRNPDNECRVFYVGASRARRNLFVKHPGTSRHFHMPS